MPDSSLDPLFRTAVSHHQAGRLPQAEALYRQILAQNPRHAEALHLLGVLAHQVGRHDVAVDLIRQAIGLHPGSPEMHCNLGTALKEMGRIDEAIAAYRQAVALNPHLPEAHYNLGNELQKKGDLDDAIASYRRALQEKLDYALAHNNLGSALHARGRLDEALASLRQALALQPNNPETHYNLGTVLQAKRRPDEAIASYRRALSLKPDYAKAHSNLGNALQEKGLLVEAIASYQRALAIQPDFAKAHSNLIFVLQYAADYDSAAILQEARRWNERHAAPLRPARPQYANAAAPGRRLRIGYVSSDFYNHASALFLMPLLTQHDRQAFEIFCYADVANPDEVTTRLQGHADVWRDTSGLSDAALAELIRHDRVDILVDLKVHTGGNRLLVLARQPAPVQVTWLGYPGTTGLDAVDYRLTDPYLDPPGRHDQWYCEQSIRLPDCFWCYDPLTTGPAVNALPALEGNARPFTFGSLNNFCKVNESQLGLWAQVLGAVKDSRLLLLAPEGDHRLWAREILQRQGVAPDRIEWLAPPRPEYLAAYHRIDLGLDTFPCNGHTTSLDSFWMGVPVVTLVGPTVVGRAGLCQLMNLKLLELVATTPEQYVQIAVKLAADTSRLAELRRTLRQRLEQSPLMDAPRFARNIEAAYRQMWRKWCAESAALR